LVQDREVLKAVVPEEWVNYQVESHWASSVRLDPGDNPRSLFEAANVKSRKTE
jgi:hypothetical protein